MLYVVTINTVSLFQYVLILLFHVVIYMYSSGGVPSGEGSLMAYTECAIGADQL